MCKIKKKRQPVAFGSIIQILRRVNAYPGPKKKFSFYLLFRFLIGFYIITTPCLIGLIGHFYLTTRSGGLLKTEQIENIMAWLQTAVCFAFISVVILFGNRMRIFFRAIRKHTYEKPKDSDKIIRSHETRVVLVYKATFVVCVLYALDNYHNAAFCDSKKLLNDTKAICGMSSPVWYPIGPNLLLTSAAVISSTASLLIYFPCGLLIPSIAVLSVDLVVSRIKHLKLMLRRTDLNPRGNVNQSLENFHKCIEYFNEIKCLVNQMNDCVGYIFTPEYSLITITLALLEYQLIRTASIVMGIRLSGWMVIQIYTCRKGQELLDESLDLPDIVYDMNWYDMPPEMKRTYIIFLASVQKPMCLLAKPIVVLNNDFLLRVLKSSYSFMMFLQTWSMEEK